MTAAISTCLGIVIALAGVAVVVLRAAARGSGRIHQTRRSEHGDKSFDIRWSKGRPPVYRIDRQRVTRKEFFAQW